MTVAAQTALDWCPPPRLGRWPLPPAGYRMHTFQPARLAHWPDVGHCSLQPLKGGPGWGLVFKPIRVHRTHTQGPYGRPRCFILKFIGNQALAPVLQALAAIFYIVCRSGWRDATWSQHAPAARFVGLRLRLTRPTRPILVAWASRPHRKAGQASKPRGQRREGPVFYVNHA